MLCRSVKCAIQIGGGTVSDGVCVQGAVAFLGRTSNGRRWCRGGLPRSFGRRLREVFVRSWLTIGYWRMLCAAASSPSPTRVRAIGSGMLAAVPARLHYAADSIAVL
jgi:hypothetical protein